MTILHSPHVLNRMSFKDMLYLSTLVLGNAIIIMRLDVGKACTLCVGSTKAAHPSNLPSAFVFPLLGSIISILVMSEI